MPPFSHLTSCTPTKSNLYLANSLDTVISDPALYRILTFHVPKLMYLSLFLGCTKGSVQVQDSCVCFVTKLVFMVRCCQHLAQAPSWRITTLSDVRDCLFNIFAATLCIRGHSSVRNLRTLHAVVTGTPTWLYCVMLFTTEYGPHMLYVGHTKNNEQQFFFN